MPVLEGPGRVTFLGTARGTEEEVRAPTPQTRLSYFPTSLLCVIPYPDYLLYMGRACFSCALRTQERGWGQAFKGISPPPPPLPLGLVRVLAGQQLARDLNGLHH